MRATMIGLILLLYGCQDQASGGGGARRTRITVVGSSTIYPFTTLVAERFVADHPEAEAPVIESTGTGAGMKLFCAGIGARYPDLADASRRMTRAEYERCAANHVGGVMELQVGIDGVAFARGADGPPLSLTLASIYRALAAEPGGRANTARTWRDVDRSLPAVPIRVYGPPATSGTRDALAQLILARGCAAAHDRDEAARCTRIREDGAYVDSGESDTFIVRKLAADPQAIGVFGYSYLAGNRERVSGIPIDGIAPDRDTIASGRYAGARPLYLYVKRAHLDAVPGLRAFLALYAASWGPAGPLERRGLIASPAPIRVAAAAAIAQAIPLDPEALAR